MKREKKDQIILFYSVTVMPPRLSICSSIAVYDVTAISVVNDVVNTTRNFFFNFCRCCT